MRLIFFKHALCNGRGTHLLIWSLPIWTVPMKLPSRRVAVLSFALESNVFNPEPRRLSDFQHLADDDYERDERQAGFVRRLRLAEPSLFAFIEVHFICLYRGWCGGLVPAADFAEMKRVATSGLRALGAVDGVFLDLHGAMGAEGSDDAEAELAEAVRNAAPDVRLVAASFDLHGNFSERLGAAVDLVAAYKTMPHVDMEETKTKGLKMLLLCLRHEHLRPVLVVLPIPALLPGDTVLSTHGPGRAIFRWLRDIEPSDWRVAALEEHLGPSDDTVTPVEGLYDASLFVGHGHADEARVGACVVVTGNAGAASSLQALARTIAQRYWDARADFDFPPDAPMLSWEMALDQIYAAAGRGQRALVGDLGDNANAGASGDVPFVTRRLLERSRARGETSHPRVLICGLTDRAAVAACAAAVAAEERHMPSLTVGGAHAVGSDYGDGCAPLELVDVTVVGMLNDGKWAVVEVSPTMTIVLQASSWAFFGAGDVARLGEWHPSKYDVVVVKRGNTSSLTLPMSGQGDGMEVCCLMAATPGANAHPMPPRTRIRPMYPLVPELEWSPPEGVVPRRYRVEGWRRCWMMLSGRTRKSWWRTGKRQQAWGGGGSGGMSDDELMVLLLAALVALLGVAMGVAVGTVR